MKLHEALYRSRVSLSHQHNCRLIGEHTILNFVMKLINYSLFFSYLCFSDNIEKVLNYLTLTNKLSTPKRKDDTKISNHHYDLKVHKHVFCMLGDKD